MFWPWCLHPRALHHQLLCAPTQRSYSADSHTIIHVCSTLLFHFTSADNSCSITVTPRAFLNPITLTHTWYIANHRMYPPASLRALIPTCHDLCSNVAHPHAFLDHIPLPTCVTLLITVRAHTLCISRVLISCPAAPHLATPRLHILLGHDMCHHSCAPHALMPHCLCLLTILHSIVILHSHHTRKLDLTAGCVFFGKARGGDRHC